MMVVQSNVIVETAGIVTNNTNTVCEKQVHGQIHGRHAGCGKWREGVFNTDEAPLRVDRVGVSGRYDKSAISARRMNWRACSGEPGEGEVLSDCGLFPLGVESANDGKYGSLGSGVFGGLGGEMISAACPSVDELIHFSSFEPIRGGEFSGIDSSLNASAK